MIDFAFFDYVQSLTFDGDLYLGNANGKTPPYLVMYKVSDEERPNVLCYEQGDSGQALFIFDYWMGGQDNYPVNQDITLLKADGIKRQIAAKKGLITDGTNDYRIWHNKTTGAVIVGDGNNESGIYTARFTVLLYWDIMS